MLTTLLHCVATVARNKIRIIKNYTVKRIKARFNSTSVFFTKLFTIILTEKQ